MYKIARLLAASLTLVASITAAGAHTCDDMGFERIHGRWIGTPFCEEELAAHEARREHLPYSSAQLHNNPSDLEEFCQGNADPMLTTTCAPYSD